MQDRAPTKPNRYAVYDDSHNFIRYEYHERADEPTQAGTALNKATLLKDTTATILGIPTTSVPDDALVALYVGAGRYGFDITLKYPDGATPIAGKQIVGVTTITGGNAVTDSSGKVFAVSTTPNPAITVDFSEYFDLQSISVTLTSTGKITPVTLAPTALPANTPLAITTSVANKKFSQMVQDFDAAVVGGGGAGGNGPSSNSGAGGGGGGYVANALGVVNTGQTLIVIVGAGGGKTSGAGGSGGASSVSGVVSANGGSGGASSAGSSAPGNGAGGAGWNGSAATAGGASSTVYPLALVSLRAGGGGGGSGAKTASTTTTGGASGGAPYGGAGGEGGAGSTGANGSGYGGGGGAGGGSRDYGSGAGGDGYAGVVYLRWRNKA